jgi:OOP family OmpA-OmpF porin
MLAAAALSGARPSAADPTPSLALEPAPASDRAFAVERADVRGHLLPSARLVAEYAREPLVLKNAAQEIDPVVAYQLWVHALASFSLLHRFTFNVDIPFVPVNVGGSLPESGFTAPRPDTGADFGDMRLGARVKLFGTPEDATTAIAIAIASSLWIPTASEGYAGDGAARVRASLLLEAASRRLYGALNLGVRTRPSERLPGALPTRVGTALSLGFAAGFFPDAAREISLGTELVADVTLSGGARFLDPRATSAHLLLTGHYRIGGGPFEFGSAFGPGIGQGAGSADYRVLFLLGYAPETAAPPPDEDEDGIPDKTDACVDIAGIASRDPLLNGCPEAPADRDGDAIPDDNDACPTLAGEPTFVRRTHGCPKRAEPPKPAEPPRPPEPPKPAEPPRTKLVEQEIVLSQQVLFETGTAVLRPESDAVLAEVARVLAEHPEVELIEVQGHTDETGSAELNRRLGQERAESVVTWLTKRGVARGRLSPKGYGKDRPIADNATEEGRLKNRRVEFRVLRAKPTAAPPPAESPSPGGAP